MNDLHFLFYYFIVLVIIGIVIYCSVHFAKPHEIETFDELDQEDVDTKQVEKKYVFSIRKQ